MILSAEENPSWAKNIMSPLVDSGQLEINARGHYRVTVGPQPQAQPAAAPKPDPAPRRKQQGKVLGDDYFPETDSPQIVAGDYFPSGD